MKRFLLRLFFLTLPASSAALSLPVDVPGLLSTASANEPWKTEFEDICSKTQGAMEIPVPELQKLVERCEKLKPQIEALEASPRKVYMKRLQQCRDLLAYVLESKSKDKPKE